MRAVVITRPGGPEVLELREVPRPNPETGQVLVRVRAAGLNRADLLQRQGRYPAPPDAPPDIPGLELAGEVAALGTGVREWREGQRVFALTGGGAYADYVVVHERMLVPLPDRLGWSEGAAVPEAFITAHDALVAQAGLRLSERVLIHAVGSGVGLAAVQLARTLGGIPYGTARREAKIEAARALGLEDGLVLQRDLEPLIDRAREWTGSAGMDVVLDLVGGPYTPASVSTLGTRGRLVLIGTLAGARAELPLGRMLSKRLTIRGTMLRSRPLEEKIAATRAFARQVVPQLERGVVRPVVDSEFAIADVRAAHERLESDETIGKVVLVVNP